MKSRCGCGDSVRQHEADERQVMETGERRGEPVGWLLAAKTARRYPEIEEEATGRLGEYRFVGTLLSLSIGVGLAVRWLLTRGAL